MTGETQARIRELAAAGLDADEISQELAADHRTRRNLQVRELASWLLSSRLDARLTAEAENPALPEPLRAGLARMLRLLSWGLPEIGTTQPATATEVATLVQGLALRGILTEAERLRVFELAGGRLVEALPAADIAAELDAQAAAAVELSLRQRAAAGYNAVVAAIDGGEREVAALDVAWKQAWA